MKQVYFTTWEKYINFSGQYSKLLDRSQLQLTNQSQVFERDV